MIVRYNNGFFTKQTDIFLEILASIVFDMYFCYVVLLSSLGTLLTILLLCVQIAKLSTAQRVIDKHQIVRHFTAADLSELYTFNPSTYDEEKDKDNTPKLPLPKVRDSCSYSQIKCRLLLSVPPSDCCLFILSILILLQY